MAAHMLRPLSDALERRRQLALEAKQEEQQQQQARGSGAGSAAPPPPPPLAPAPAAGAVGRAGFLHVCAPEFFQRLADPVTRADARMGLKEVRRGGGAP